jgi:hypothetical protein
MVIVLIVALGRIAEDHMSLINHWTRCEISGMS